MSPVSQFVFDGSKWQNEVTTVRTAAVATTTEPTFTLGLTKPTVSNTGCNLNLIDGTLTGDQNIKIAGTTLRNKRIEGYVIIHASNVTLENCEIVGRNVGYVNCSGLVQCNSTGAVIDRCTIKPAYPRYFLNCISGSGFRAHRCNLSRGCDGIGMKGNYSVAEGCYIHDLAFFDGTNTYNGNGTEHASDARFPGWTHNDGIQIYGYSGNRVEGCNILGYFSGNVGNYNTAMYTGNPNGTNAGRKFPSRNYAHGIFCSPTSSVLRNVVIRNNWIEGGEICIQSGSQGRGYDSGNSVTIQGNRLGCDQKPGYTGNISTKYLQMSLMPGIGTFTVDSNIYDVLPSVPSDLQAKSIGAGRVLNGQWNWQVYK